MSNFTTETKVGALVVAAAIGIGWLTMQSGSIFGAGLTQDNRFLESEFSDVEGIAVGSSVKMAGVQVGEVTDIELSPSGYATIRFSVEDEIPLASNVSAQIASSGLIGEKFIALITEFGAAQDLLGENVVRIPSTGSANPADIASNFAKVSDDLEEITAALRGALGGPENAGKLKNIVNSMENVTTRLDGILNDEIQQNKIKDIVDGLADFSNSLKAEGGTIIDDVKASAQSMRTILEDNEGNAAHMIQNMGIAAKNLASITARLEAGEGPLGQLMQGENNMVADLQQAAADLKEITAKVNKGEGSIGKLINDPATVEKIEGALDSLAGFSERVENFRTEVDFHGYSLTNEGVSKGRFGITLAPRPTRYYVIGVTGDGFAAEENKDFGADPAFQQQDFGNSLKFTLQFGHVYQNAFMGQDVGFRIGVKDSAFGVGIDMKQLPTPFFGHFVDISADLYDFGGENSGAGSNQNPHLDLTAKVNLVDKTIYAIGGYDDVFNDKYGSPFIGLGFRFQDDDLKYLVGQAL